MFQSSRPIIIVTGANGGVGFGICQRLLFQLCHTNPSDAEPQSFAQNNVHIEPGFQAPASGRDGLTLIMACRDVKRADVARTKLLQLLDNYVAKLKTQPEYGGHAEAFQKNVVLDTRELDLAIIGSVFKFATGVAQKYPYVSHLICNAGVISFKSIDWVGAWTQVFTDFIGSISTPIYVRQHVGELTVDGLGWVWQCNLFGHYALFRSLQHLLSSPSFPHPARVIWISSIEASPTFYNGIEDWQNKTTEYSYQSTKYQLDILVTQLEKTSVTEAQQPWSETQAIHHFVADPGICSTNVNRDMTGPFMNAMKLVFFYIARFFGSTVHTIDPFKAALCATHLALAPLALFVFCFPASSSNSARSAPSSTPAKFRAAVDRWGNATVRLLNVREWEKNKGDAADISVKCEELYQSFRKGEEATMDSDITTEPNGI